MKTIFRIGIFLLAPILLTGCLVFSLNPWIDADDRIYDERLIGRWISDGWGDSEVWEFIVGRGRDKCYRVKWIVREEGQTTRHKITACVAKIGGELILDYTGIDWNSDDDDKLVHDLTSHLHQVARLRFDDGRLLLHTLSGDDGETDVGLLGGLAARPFADGDDFETDALLLESTDDLMQFLVTHGSDEAIWGDDPLVILTRKK